MTSHYLLGQRPGDNNAEGIKHLRVEIGLPQQALAERIGVSFATVNPWENQQTKPSRLYWNELQKLEMCVAEDPRQEDSSPYDKPVKMPPSSILDFTAKSDIVKVLAGGERLSFGHLMTPAFATEISSVGRHMSAHLRVIQKEIIRL